MRLVPGCAFLLTLWCPSSAQVLSISTITAVRGTPSGVEISLASPPDKAPVALQWEIEAPARFMNSALPQPGDALKKAGKSITCSGKWKKAPVSYTYLCIAAGGKQSIGDGVIAVLPVTVPADAKAGTMPVKIEKAHAVLSDLKKVSIKNAQGAVTVAR